jgi:hypothetical protein
MLFKIKKFLLPTLLACSKHLPPGVFDSVIYQTFMKFALDDIWGVRKVCLERLHDLVKSIGEGDSQKLRQSLDFLQASLSDASRWVKNQAFSLFGVVAHEIHERAGALVGAAERAQLKGLIGQAFDKFYDPKWTAPP